MEKEKLFLSEENTMLPTWNSSSSFGMEIQSNHLNCSSEQLPNCFFNPNWDNNSMDQTDPFESALSSMVSSPAAAASGGDGDGVVLRELIGRLGSICNSVAGGGEMSPPPYIGANNNNSTNNSSYSTPLNSPPKLNLSIMDHQIRGNLQIPGNNLQSSTPFCTDPGFAERAAKFSSLGSKNFGQFGQIESEMGHRLVPRMELGKISVTSSTHQSMKFAGSSMGLQENKDGLLQEGNWGSDKKFTRLSRSSTPENGEFGDSREESSVSEQIPGGEIGIKGQNDANARKRKSIPKGKGKETPSSSSPVKDSKVVSGNEESNSKRSKGDENVKLAEQSKDSGAKPPEPPKDYIHVRARGGQATDSHSLAERVSREKISERMKFLQDLVPGCNKAMNLRSTTPPRLSPQCFSNNQRAALAEITNVLQAVCHANRLPLALTWIPCCYTEVEGVKIMKVRVRGDNTNLNGKCILCIEDTACYVNDRDMQGFMRACAQNYLEEGQGIVGKALESNQPFFFSDVKDYDISEYPLVHHARKFALNAAVAIRLRSTYTGDDDYILELFLPLNMKGSTEHQLLLNNLSCTMQRICKSLRTVSDAEVVGAVGCKVGSQKGSVMNFPTVASSGRTSQQEFDDNLNSIEQMPLSESGLIPLGSERDGPTEQKYPLGEQAIMEIDGLNNGKNVVSVEETQITGKKGTRKTLEREFGKLESSISFDDLKQQFGRKLEDAAENLGMSRSTLKRISRKHGIPRWPSHKRNRYNCSSSKLKDINGSIGAAEKSTCPASFAAYPFPAIDSTSQLASMNCSTQHIQRMNQDVSIFTIKATYGEVMIKFRFSSISGLVFLEEEVAKRLKLKSGSFIIQYQDSDNDCILIACDEDLFDLMDDAKSLGSTTVRLSVEPTAS